MAQVIIRVVVKFDDGTEENINIRPDDNVVVIVSSREQDMLKGMAYCGGDSESKTKLLVKLTMFGKILAKNIAVQSEWETLVMGISKN